MKPIKTISTVTLTILMLMFFISCDDFLDVNVNPNAPGDATENLMLPGLLGEFSYRVIGNWPARYPAYWVQQLAWNGVPPTQDNYEMTESNADAAWNFLFTRAMKNARELNERAEARGNYRYAGIAKLIFAWSLSIATDLYNDIPYSEGFDPVGNPLPAYDTQEEIYQTVFGYLNAALEDFDRDPGALTPGTDDLLYSGDIERWRRLAYTLKARFHMRLSYAPGNSAEERAQNALNALANGFQSGHDDANFAYENAPGAQNPWWQFTMGVWDDRDQLSATYIDLLHELNDPRIHVQARPIEAVFPDSIAYVGHVNGTNGIGVSNVSRIGEFYNAAAAPLNWISYSEAKFIEAEAIFILQGAGSADPVYRDAIAASMDRINVDAHELVSPGEVEEYINSLPALTEIDDPYEAIMVQKYIANFLNPEIYNDWRRTGYPQLDIIEDPVVDEIPRRFPYPLTEWQNNLQNVEAAGVSFGFASMTHRVWWDTRD